MGKIFYVMGKSSSGKDTIYKELGQSFPDFHTVTIYTTRPIRKGERDGVEYFFADEDRLSGMEAEGKVIEQRTYHTVHGEWKYFTADDGQIDLAEKNYLIIGTLESYARMREYFGAEALVPIYIEVEDGIRLRRAIDRETAQKNPKYAELCRRFLADTADFSEENLSHAGIENRFCNDNLKKCLQEITLFIQKEV